tara:strand:+ start:2191 stop:2586 length:396 start_codon:yes stop_codon:yes gene_type:complete
MLGHLKERLSSLAINVISTVANGGLTREQMIKKVIEQHSALFTNRQNEIIEEAKTTENSENYSLIFNCSAKFNNKQKPLLRVKRGILEKCKKQLEIFEKYTRAVTIRPKTKRNTIGKKCRKSEKTQNGYKR